MPSYLNTEDYRHTQPPKLGVLLTNLGTPDQPTTASVRRYLAEFLWDPRVIEVPRPLWWLILNGVILRFRPRRSAAAYRKVWSEQGSPLLVNARAQENGIREALDDALPGRVEVTLGMRYGEPSIKDALRQLKAAGVTRLLVFPLYPQYSATTTASTFDALAAELQTWRWMPELRFISCYHDEPGYIDALAASIRDHWAAHGRGERLLFSFHGLPQSYLDKGDPYHCQCHKTARLVAEALELPAREWKLAFQSRVGGKPWLKPYTDHMLEEWGREGLRTVDVICPGFSADCLETLEEIAMQNAELFQEKGGGELRYIPALNQRPDHVHFLISMVLRNFSGWREAGVGYDQQAAATEATESRKRATGHGRDRLGGSCAAGSWKSVSRAATFWPPCITTGGWGSRSSQAEMSGSIRMR